MILSLSSEVSIYRLENPSQDCCLHLSYEIFLRGKHDDPPYTFHGLNAKHPSYSELVEPVKIPDRTLGHKGLTLGQNQSSNGEATHPHERHLQSLNTRTGTRVVCCTHSTSLTVQLLAGESLRERLHLFPATLRWLAGHQKLYLSATSTA